MLCVQQAWKEQLYPLLKQHLAEQVDSSISYLVLYHEAAVANLLEVRVCGLPLGQVAHTASRLCRRVGSSSSSPPKQQCAGHTC